MTLTAGMHIGHYEIRLLLGKGGMGEVYLAQDMLLKRPVAIKILPSECTADAARLRRFQQEAQAASALNHPNIITIHALESEDSLHYIVSEYIDGQSLRERSLTDRIALDKALDIAIQVASALAAAHEAGIVHRDIKPDNIMLRQDGHLKVLDFGLAKLTDCRGKGRHSDPEAVTIEAVNTESGMIMGTARYMSPEQARGLSVDNRTDIWSLGVVLYELLSAHPPFEGVTPSDLLVSILEREPPPLENYLPDLPRELDRMALLQK